MKWALKIGAKLLIARLPIPYSLWKSLGLFRHGQMDSTDYSFNIFKLHVKRAYPNGFPSESIVLELGPGDSIASGIIASAHGAARCYLVDVGDFSNKDITFYQALASSLKQRDYNPLISRRQNLSSMYFISATLST